MKVVSKQECSASGIYQNPKLASTLLKHIAPVSWARVSSTLGIGWVSLKMLLLSGFKSTQILTSPDFFWYHHYSCTPWSWLKNLAIDSHRLYMIKFIYFTFSLMGMGAFLGVYSTCSVASSCSLMTYSSLNVSNPVHLQQWSALVISQMWMCICSASLLPILQMWWAWWLL